MSAFCIIRSLVIFILVVNRIYEAKGGVIEPPLQSYFIIAFVFNDNKKAGTQSTALVKFKAQLRRLLKPGLLLLQNLPQGHTVKCLTRSAVVGFPIFLSYLIYEKVVVTSFVIEIFSKIRSVLCSTARCLKIIEKVKLTSHFECSKVY